MYDVKSSHNVTFAVQQNGNRPVMFVDQNKLNSIKNECKWKSFKIFIR